jgi:hypothetical protein
MNAEPGASPAAGAQSIPRATARPGLSTYIHWIYTKRRLNFCAVSQYDDQEGCLRPTQEQAATVRDVLGIDKRREFFG